MDIRQQLYNNPLRTEPITDLLKKFTIPAIISMLINAVYNIVDQIFLGQLIGSEANAATTIAFPVFMFILSLAVLLGVGTGIFISTKLGERNIEAAQSAFKTVIAAVSVISIIITVLGFIFIEPIVKMFGANPDILSASIQYTSIIILGTWANMMIVVMDKILRADNSPRQSMIFIVLGALLNTILDPVLISFMGIRGAAFATIFSQFVTAILMFRHVYTKGSLRIPLREYFNITFNDFKILKSSMYIGLSSFILQIGSIFTQIILNRSLIHYGNLTPEVGGTVALAAVGIVLKIYLIMTSVCVGIGIGFQPIISYNNGARLYDRVYETFKRSALIAVIVTVLGFIIVETFPGAIILIFDSYKGTFYNFGIHALRIYLGASFLVGIQIVIVMYFQAMGKPLISAIISSTRQIFILIPSILLLPLILKLDGILYSGPLSDTIAFIMSVVFIKKELKKLKRLIEVQKNERI